MHCVLCITGNHRSGLPGNQRESAALFNISCPYATTDRITCQVAFMQRYQPHTCYYQLPLQILIQGQSLITKLSEHGPNHKHFFLVLLVGFRYHYHNNRK